MPFGFEYCSSTLMSELISATFFRSMKVELLDYPVLLGERIHCANRTLNL
jgi:hypothetical protein